MATDDPMEVSYDPLVLELSVPFQTPSDAEIAHNTLIVDPEPPRSEVIKTFRLDGSTLHVTLQAQEARMLRVATGALFDLLILVTKTIKAFKMWHAARKQEKKVREVMVDFQKRAERRREHYEKLRGDPHQLLRIHGNRCKMHLNPKKSGELDASMISWQGDTDNMISRYDVRIHLDYIPDKRKLPPVELSREEAAEESRCNYERYRTLVQNLFHDLPEDNALKQIEVEEMYPKKPKGGREAKGKSRAKAAIGFSYSGDGGGRKGGQEEDGEREMSDDSEYEVDMDVDSFTSGQVDRLNVLALDYGIPAGAFSKTLRKEKSQLEEQKQARLLDKEKANLSGRKSRKERQQIKEQQSFPHLPTPPSYARRDSPTYEPYKEDKRSETSSRSSSSEPEGKVEFITEFGEHSEPESTNEVRATASHVPSAERPQKEDRKRRRSYSRDRDESSSRSRHRGRRSPSPRRRRSRDGRSRHHSRRSYSRTPSPKRRSSHRRRRSRSYSRDRYHRRSRSRSPYRRRRSRSRSPYHRRRSSSRTRHHRGRSRSRSPRRRRSRSKNRHSRSRSRSPRRNRRSRSHSNSGNHRQNKRSRSSSSSSSSSGSSSANEKQRSKSRSVSPDSSKQRLPSKSVSRSRSRSPKAHSHSNERKDTGEDEDKAKSDPSVGVVKTKLTPQERLMRRMQAQLNKQFKMDKKNQQKKEKIKEAEKMEREELLREHMKKIRDVRDDRPEYEITSKGEMYSEQPSRSPTPPSPVQDLLASAVKKDPAEFYYGRFM